MYIPIKFVDFLFGEMCIYSLRDFFFFLHIIYNDFLMDFLNKYRVKYPHF